MRIRIVAVGTRMPAWVSTGCDEYFKRLPATLKAALVELPPARREAGAPPARAMADEARRILAALNPDDFVSALDERGTQPTTLEFADWLRGRMMDGRDLTFLIGGPDGYDASVLARANHRLSLSRMTLPHAMVRVVLAEQLYRAHTVLTNHPYHRE